MVGRSQHHIQNTKVIKEQVNNIKLGPGECTTSYGITALSMSVPVNPALNIVQSKLEQDLGLQRRNKLTIQHSINLLGFCLHNTYFLFQGKYYEQVEGAAMGSPVSPVIVYIYM